MKRKRTNIWQRGTIWWIQYYVRGVRHRESSRSTKEIDAKNLLDQSIAEVRAGRPVGRRIEPTTLEELLAILVDDYRANGSVCDSKPLCLFRRRLPCDRYYARSNYRVSSSPPARGQGRRQHHQLRACDVEARLQARRTRGKGRDAAGIFSATCR
jgi:hypothetical protein